VLCCQVINIVVFTVVCPVGIGGKSSGSRKTEDYGSGMKTLRLRSKGTATVEAVIWHADIFAAVCLCLTLILWLTH